MNRPAPAMIGHARAGTRTAPRSRGPDPSARPAVMVTPSARRPAGGRAPGRRRARSRSARPSGRRCPCRWRARRSTTYRTTPNTASMTAISHGSPSLSWITSSKSGPGDGAGDRADRRAPTRAARRSWDRAGARSSCTKAFRYRHDVAPEVDERAHERPDVQGHVEGLVQVRVVQDRPVEQPRHEDQVAGARHRRELGHALGDAEHDRLQDAHPAVLSVGGAARY